MASPGRSAPRRDCLAVRAESPASRARARARSSGSHGLMLMAKEICLAVLATHPTSRISGGSILCDRPGWASCAASRGRSSALARRPEGVARNACEVVLARGALTSTWSGGDGRCRPLRDRRRRLGGLLPGCPDRRYRRRAPGHQSASCWRWPIWSRSTRPMAITKTPAERAYSAFPERWAISRRRQLTTTNRCRRSV